MGIRTRIGAALAASVVAGAMLDAQGTLRIATIAPDNSAYVKTLREMADAWNKRTSGRVRSSVLAGTAGSEATMLNNMRGSARSLHVAQLSAISLGQLDNAFNVFSLPMFFQSYGEADRALAKLAPMLEQRLEQKGLKALNFAYAGWVHVFSKQPVRSVADLKKQTLFTATGDDVMAKWYRDNGFQPKQLDPTQMLESLGTGGIQATPAPPVFAQILNWYVSAPYMMDIGFAPLLGATVMSLESWKRISPEDQAIVLDEARKAGDRLRTTIPKIEKEAIEEMKKKKLTVTTADAAEWRKLADQLAQAMLAAKLVPQDAYDIARRERDAARTGK